MDPRQKKTTRDLTDLKSRLGLAKPAAGAQPDNAPGAGQPGPVGTGPQPTIRSAPVPGPLPPPGVIPPPGVVPPPGMQAPYAQPQPPPPDPRRDPFAAQQQAAHPGYQPIVDAGPPLEIPAEKKSHSKLALVLLITALIPLGVGWACGRIYGARILFNKGIEDAKQIQDEVTKIAGINRKLAEAIAKSQPRNQGKITYDEKMVEEIKDVLRAAPSANPERAKTMQDRLFRTNYAMMDDIVINRLFQYYNNSIRLYEELEGFIQRTERSKELILAFASEAETSAQKYGIVFAEDAGRYFLGQLVEVGNIDCADEKAKECKKEDIKGFMVRMGASGSWQPRPGKPGNKEKITDIVVPIIPDENWKQVAVGKRGFLAYNEYKRGYLTMLSVCALLARDEKPLMQDLGKAAGRNKVFAPL